MRVVLAAINAKYIHSNLAVYSLKAYAHEYGEQVAIAEYTINQQTDDILMDLYRREPDILCFSCYIWNISYVEMLVREIKKILPGICIWVGGPEVSYDSVAVLTRLPEIDLVMKGEGEESFAGLLAQVLKKDAKNQSISYEQVDGITYRNESGIHENKWREIMDLSDVPFVYHQMEDFRNKIIYYETSRGCPFSCSYCLSSVDKCLRFRNLELVDRELQFFIDHKVPQVKFVDRTFNCNHKHALHIWSYLLAHDNGITNFHFEIAADLLTEGELKLIEQMRPGLIQLEIGVQSTNIKTVKEIKRTMNFPKVADVVHRINAMGNVHQHLDLIVGLPYEDYKSFSHSFNEVYELLPEQLQVGFLKVLKGSYMEAEKTRYGLIYQNIPPYEVLQTNWISYQDIIRLKGIEEMVEVYYNSRQFTHTMAELVHMFETPFVLYEALGAWYDTKKLHAVSHSRVARYEILLEFINTYDVAHISRYRALLTYDFYLRENAKNRPLFAGEETTTKEWVQDFYNTEAKMHKYLKGYERYDTRQLRKMTHIERFQEQIGKSNLQSEQYILFDYQNRNPLNKEAQTYVIETSSVQ
ncbi:MAG: B12-binding domain-containing radical SAM protein [Lachnospiraceae bacterium]